MSWKTELVSWLYLPSLKISATPQVGDKAPSTEQLVLPCNDERPAMIVFLRHCGCPFAEKTFKEMRKAAEAHPEIHFIAVSHSDAPSTAAWVEAVGGPGNVGVIIDAHSTLYARFGLGASDWWHLFNVEGFWSLFKLAQNEGIKNRPTQSGSRWQTGGVFAVDSAGVVKYGGRSARMDDIPNFEASVEAVK